MSLKRMITSLIGLPIIVLILFYGNEFVVGATVLVAGIICTYEYFNVIKQECKPIKWIGYLSNAYILLSMFLSNEIMLKIVLYSIPIILLLLFSCVIITNMKITFKDVAFTFLGCLYIPFFLMFLELLRKMDNGKVLIGFIFVISWSTDIFAYLIGRNFGKHKFSKISTGKTIEGCIAGLIGAVVITTLYTFIVNSIWKIGYSYLNIGIISLVLSFISQIGDFAASIVKRYADVKDYGTLLPGHGGMLDRIDSLLFIAPFAYMIFSIL